MYVCMYVYIYIYIYRSLSLYIYIHIHTRSSGRAWLSWSFFAVRRVPSGKMVSE